MVPSLVIVPSSSMAYWKGEVEYWLDDSSEVVFYSGPPGARQQIAANELWLQPGALDGKIRSEVDSLTTRVPKPHIVVTSMESMLQVRFSVLQTLHFFVSRSWRYLSIDAILDDHLQDIEEMKNMPWDIIVLDERHASKSFAQKMYPVLHELTPRQRVSMREASGDINAEQLLAWAAFLRPSRYKVCQGLPLVLKES